MMVLNILIMSLSLLGGDTANFNNYLETALWIASIAGSLSMYKWGYAFAIFTLNYTLSTSVGILIYYGIWINAIRVIISLAIIIYLFGTFFESKTR